MAKAAQRSGTPRTGAPRTGAQGAAAARNPAQRTAAPKEGAQRKEPSAKGPRAKGPSRPGRGGTARRRRPPPSAGPRPGCGGRPSPWPSWAWACRPTSRTRTTRSRRWRAVPSLPRHQLRQLTTSPRRSSSAFRWPPRASVLRLPGRDHQPYAWRSGRREFAVARLLFLIVGIGFVLYLLYAELFQIGSICLYCTSGHVITFLLFVLTGRAAAIWDWPRAAFRGPRVPRPALGLPSPALPPLHRPELTTG